WREQVVPLSRTNRDEEVFPLAIKSGAGGMAAREAMYKLGELNDVNAAVANHSLKLADQDSRKSQYILSAVILLAIILGLVFAIRQGSLIAGSVNTVSKAAQLMAAGDLNQRVMVKTGDEIESMANSFNTMTFKLKTMVEELQREITERRRAEDRLRESEQWLSTTLRSIGDAVIATDTDGLVTLMNPVAEDLTGWDETETAGKPLEDIFNIINDQTGGRAENPVTRVLQKGVVVGMADHTVLIAKDGTKRHIADSGAPIRDEEGEIIGTVMVFRDITERKQAEEELRKHRDHLEELVQDRTEALRESEKKTKQVKEYLELQVDRMPIGLILWDAEFHVTSWNPAAEKIFGFTAEETLGKHPYDLVVPKEAQPQVDDIWRRLLEGDMTAYSTNENITKDGGTIICEWTNTPLKETDGTVLGVLSMVKDITEQKKLEEQFRQSQKMEAIGTLAGGVAHDFNNLLTVIIGNSQLALMDVIKDESLRKKIEEIEKAGDRAASLTRQLLAFSRKQIITPRVLDLNELLTGIEKMLGRLIGEDVELLTIPGPALWQVEVDPGQMEQVIMNMAINAKDAMPQGGKITIETANTDLDENYFRKHGIEGEKPGHYVMLAVSDTGIGMDKETQEHIFEPFFTTKEVGKGTGLGLSTVYGIVKQNNGFVWVYSEPGQGSTFKVYLPRAEGAADSEEKQQLPVIELDGSETVLIVEDDNGLRKFAQEVLLLHGYKVLDAENGEDALRVSQAHEGQIHLMITDVVMPRMGGKELSEKLQPFYPRMKVIYMSGYTDNAIVEHGVLAPGLNFLQKPFTPESLALKVREVLDAEN
ncbi:MAG: PAS domain S-box protein, partial [Proteobacteria bacterium]|nr:PAS domain S-box protein [Pseudomonadota bacterium]